MDKEIAALREYLDGQREHVLKSVEGLDEEQLRRPVLPTGWSCLGLIRHLTYDVERFWFAGVQAGEPDATAAFVAGAETHWTLPAEADGAQVLAA